MNKPTSATISAGDVQATEFVAVWPFSIPARTRLEGLKDGEWRTVGENATEVPAVIEVRIGEDVSGGADGRVSVRVARLEEGG